MSASDKSFFARLRDQLAGKDSKQHDLVEAASRPIAIRAASHIAGAETALKELGYALDGAGRVDQVRELAKVAEMHRLCSQRFAALMRRLGEVE